MRSTSRRLHTELGSTPQVDFYGDVAARLDAIAEWERRPRTDIINTLVFLGLGVYERLVVEMGALLPPGCPTPRPSAHAWAASPMGERLLQSEAHRYLERWRRFDVDWKKERDEQRARFAKRSVNRPTSAEIAEAREEAKLAHVIPQVKGTHR